MFTADDLADMRAAQEAVMMDTAIRQVYSRTYDSYGAPVETWTDATTSLICGLDMRPGSERHGSEMSTVEYEVTMRLPITTVIDPKDRLKVTHRFGEAITNIVYKIEAPIQRGPSGIRLLLRRVEV